jgi:hypothetical protein
MYLISQLEVDAGREGFRRIFRFLSVLLLYISIELNDLNII